MLAADFSPLNAQMRKTGVDKRLTIARVIYDGGGDWYSNPSSLPNLLAEIKQATGLPVADEEVQLSLKTVSYTHLRAHET